MAIKLLNLASLHADIGAKLEVLYESEKEVFQIFFKLKHDDYLTITTTLYGLMVAEADTIWGNYNELSSMQSGQANETQQESN